MVKEATPQAARTFSSGVATLTGSASSLQLRFMASSVASPSPFSILRESTPFAVAPLGFSSGRRLARTVCASPRIRMSYVSRKHVASVSLGSLSFNFFIVHFSFVKFFSLTSTFFFFSLYHPHSFCSHLVFIVLQFVEGCARSEIKNKKCELYKPSYIVWTGFLKKKK